MHVEVIGPGNQHTPHIIERLQRLQDTSDRSVVEALVGFEGHFVTRILGNTAVAYKRMVEVWTEHNEQAWPFINIVCISEKEGRYQHNKNRLDRPQPGNGNRATINSTRSVLEAHPWFDITPTFLVLTCSDAQCSAPDGAS